MFTAKQILEWKQKKLIAEFEFLSQLPKALKSSFSDARLMELKQELLSLGEMTQEQWDVESDLLFRMHGGK